MEDEDRGFSLNPGKMACLECFNDEGIWEFIISNPAPVSANCSFCSGHAKSPNNSSLDDIIGHIFTRLNTIWEDPVNESPYNGRGGGYQHETFTTRDLLDYYELTDCENLCAEISNAILNENWSRRYYYSLTENETLTSAWKSFCSHIKHNSRYFFLDAQNHDYDKDQHDEINPVEILGILANLFVEDTIPVNQSIYRARFDHDKANHNTKESLGRPPTKAALPNRMSPSGISMFYGACELETAIAETYSKAGSHSRAFWGQFTPKKRLRMIRLPSKIIIPSLFGSEYKEQGNKIFLTEFIADFTKRISTEGNHDSAIEYVPTQVVTEYIRHILKPSSGGSYEGIIYPSSVNQKDAIVLFDDEELDLVKTGFEDQQ